MKIKQCMIYKEVITKRLSRKREQIKEYEQIMSGGGEITPTERRKYIECKAAILELENVIDIAESMFTTETCNPYEKN